MHSNIDGPGGGRNNSFISGIPNEMHHFVNQGRGDKTNMEAPISPLTPTDKPSSKYIYNEVIRHQKYEHA